MALEKLTKRTKPKQRKIKKTTPRGPKVKKSER